MKHSRGSVLDMLPEYARIRIEQRRQAASTQRLLKELGRAAVAENLPPEEYGDLAKRLMQVNRAALLPEGCHLSPQSQKLFNLLVRRKNRASFLTIAKNLWLEEYEDREWADLDPRSPEFHRLAERIKGATRTLGKHLLNGEAKYETHFSRRQSAVTLEKLR